MIDNIFLFQDKLIATIFFVIVAIINKTVYDRKNNRYIKTKTKALNSVHSFRHLHKIIRISTLIIFIGSVWIDNTIWIKLFSGTTFLYGGIAITSLAMVLFLIAGINSKVLIHKLLQYEYHHIFLHFFLKDDLIYHPWIQS